MRDRYGAIVIGAGIIGAATAFELAKLGYRTLSVDRNPAAGYGPTSNSCAIIRVYYSTFDGVAFAWEAYHYWKGWAEYLATDDDRGLARFIDCGCVVMKTEHNGGLEKHIRLSKELGIPCEEWDRAAIRERIPHYDLRRFGPPRAMDDERFGEPSGGELAGAVFWPNGGYVSDPQLATHNLQRAAEARGVEFAFRREVVGILTDEGRVRGVTLDGGETVESPVVVNVAGPHSAIVNAMAGALDDMTIETKPLRQEVAHVPAPRGSTSRPARTSSRTATSAATPAPRPAITSSSGARIPSATGASMSTPTATSAISPIRRRSRPCGSASGSRRSGSRPAFAASPISTTSPTTGSRSTTRAGCRGSTWRSGARGTSSRMPRSRAR